MLKLNKQTILLIILFLTAAFRLFRLDYPKDYVFDEVYHAFTAKEYLKGSKEAWEWWTTPPKGVAYEWTHPPLAKELMTASMFLTHSTDAWAYRLPGAILGVLSVFLVYKLGVLLFKNELVGVLAAFIFSLDGLNFVQSRVGMNDIYFLTFVLASLLFFLKKRFLLCSVLFSLAIASKWTAVYLLILFAILILKDIYTRQISLGRVALIGTHLIIITPLIYLATYTPFFLQGHSLEQFIHLQQQMWWYHTGLKATHDYASPWWSWPLNLYPVWYFVDYKGEKVANIFVTGNPVVFWFGTGAILLTIYDLVQALLSRTRIYLKNIGPLAIILLGFFIFWLPWAFSPRIMFLYHFAPSVPFLSLALGYQLGSLFQTKRKLVLVLLGLIALSSLVVYPFLTGIPLPKEWVKFFFFTNLSKNPF